MNLREILKNKLSEKELNLIPKSFDLIGSKAKAVVVVEIPEELKGKEKLIAEAVMQLHKPVKSVLRKVSERKGKLRLREYKLIFGDKNTEVLHKEYGCLFKLDPKKVYFSPREAEERQRVAEQVKPDETVLVMFSGVAPFPVSMAKMQPKVNKIYAVELNPIAHKYAVENVKLNKVKDKVEPILGDVRKICPKLKGKFDRVVMPLPKGAYQFLGVAVPCLKAKGIIHFYHWASETKLFEEAIELVKKECEKLGKKVKFLNKCKVLPYGPRKWKVCIDAEIS